MHLRFATAAPANSGASGEYVCQAGDASDYQPNLIMRCLNSPSVLNSLELKIVDRVPTELRHVLVVNAGDGRLARAIRDKVGAGVVVSVVTIHPSFLEFVDDFEGRSSNPWDLAWYNERVAAHGAFDYVVLYHLHEFWRGELFQYQRLLNLVKPGAVVWTSLLNAQSLRLMTRFIPPLRLGFSALSDPLRCVVNVDFASLLDFIGKNGGVVTDLWGMLDQNAQEFCQQQPSKPTQWESRGVKVSIGTFADAFLWGAMVVAIGFKVRTDPATLPVPSLSFSAFSGNLLQALIFPYPDIQMHEGLLSMAQFEMDAWRKAPASAVGQLPRFVLDQLGDMNQPKRVLLVGSGWGRELVLLKRQFPKWDWVGYDGNRELVAMGKSVVFDAGASAVDGPLTAPLPFADRSFDCVISLGYFSTLFEAAARHLAAEVCRVARGGIHHLEDGRGPDQGMQLKTYSLKSIYSELGRESNAQPLLADGLPSGMYLLTVASVA